MQDAEKHDTTICKGFKGARRSLGLSIAEAARVLCVNERTLSRWESGKDGAPSPVSSKLMQRFLDGFRPQNWPLWWSGNDLREARLALEMSTEEMGDFIGLDAATVELYEDGDGPSEMVCQAVKNLLEFGE